MHKPAPGEEERPRTGPDEQQGEPVEGPLEDAASVLREPVDLGHTLLDEAELGTDEAPVALVERAEMERDEEEKDEALEAESLLHPPAIHESGEVSGPEELEARLESEAESAEIISLHDEEPLTEAFSDEGVPLEDFEPDAVEIEVERRAEQDTAAMHAATIKRPVHPRATTPVAGGPVTPEQETDPGKFRRLLEAERARLEQLQGQFEGQGLRQRSGREDLSSLSAVDQHPADQGTETFDRERDLSIRDQVEGELAEVDMALRRLDEGTYGRCEACGRPIGAERLGAAPATRLCLDDQRQLERELAFKHREVEL